MSCCCTIPVAEADKQSGASIGTGGELEAAGEEPNEEAHAGLCCGDALRPPTGLPILASLLLELPGRSTVFKYSSKYVGMLRIALLMANAFMQFIYENIHAHVNTYLYEHMKIKAKSLEPS